MKNFAKNILKEFVQNFSPMILALMETTCTILQSSTYTIKQNIHPKHLKLNNRVSEQTGMQAQSKGDIILFTERAGLWGLRIIRERISIAVQGKM